MSAPHEPYFQPYVARGAVADRRSERRRAAVGVVWLRSEPAGRAISAWLMNESAGGACVLVAAEDAGRLSQQVHLQEMPSPETRLARANAALPEKAIVLRIEPGEGVTRRIALGFLAGRSAPLRASPEAGRAAAQCRDSQTAAATCRAASVRSDAGRNCGMAASFSI